MSDADRQISTLKEKTEAYAKEAKAESMKAINDADRKIEDKAAQAKSGVSSWFGGSK